ncbi:hypothetical protein [Caulobacter endophyticus]|uniref:Uncharacterized protein n=1 Tax=Caulobacter endophyticus TaxID=2172652 RepID=A0A2T9K6T6_9CAUL|nr:hypothetical protein [Caulobacter endophyticus]PVM91521.1 hypothetical protein DDF67_06840 [Caulobacter endophyticus]
MRLALPVAILVALLTGQAALADAKPPPKPDYVAKGEAAQAVSRKVRHHDVQPFAALDETAPLGRAWSSSSFYALRDDTGGRRWVVRRAWGNLSGAGGLVWADSRTCPAVAAMLKGMEALTLRPDVPGLGAEDLKPPSTDPGLYAFWSYQAVSEGGGWIMGLSATGDHASPLARWWNVAGRELAKCWTEQEPG